jgi:hypothetical protein
LLDYVDRQQLHTTPTRLFIKVVVELASTLNEPPDISSVCAYINNVHAEL